MNTSFDQFWDLYDLKKSREKVERKWLLMSAKNQVACMESLPAYIKSTPDRQFRKHPATYLNNCSWNDKIYKPEEESLNYVSPKEFVETKYKGTTGQEMYEGMKRLALDKGEIMKVGDWTGAYSYAWKENLIHRMNEKERSEYKESVILALQTEKRANFLPENFNINNSIQSECHKRVLQVHFQELINQAT